ncbi:DUF2934 domain-containing protein [Paraburkholderia sp. BR10937]|uniref:DUF2934 domain-containing protein n=1 Tax=Paraburkholderia sp. BR10937 TaxID=3236994 RepID=UPI0034D1D3B0
MGNKSGQPPTARAADPENGGDAGWPGKPGPDPHAGDSIGPSADEEMTERIRVRAYQLWQAAGSPENRADDYWYEAETQVRAGVVPPKQPDR